MPDATPVDADRAAELARRLIEGVASARAVPSQARLDVAWALKDACYAAWSSEPQRVVKAADALRALLRAMGDASDAPGADLAALAAWTEGIAQITQGRMAEAAASLERAGVAFAAAGDAAHAAQTQVARIMALSMLGHYTRAAECARDTLQALLRLGDRHTAAKVSLNLGALNVRRGDYAAAARCSREAAVLFARVGDSEHSIMADVNAADALTAMGDFDEARRLFARAGQRARAHRFPVLHALVEESSGLLDLARGRYGAALRGLEGARRAYEKLGTPQPLAIAEKQLGDAYLELRLLPEALALFDHAVDRFAELATPDEQAWALLQRGRTLAQLGQADTAAEALAQAARLFARQEHGAGTAAVMLARAELALAGERFTAALDLAQAAAQGFVALQMTEGQARAALVRAYALLATGRTADAAAVFDATLAQAQASQLLWVQFRCLSGRADAAAAAGDGVAARADYQRAVALFEEQRRVLPGAALRSAFLADNLRPYCELLRFALDAAGADGADVLQHLERYRARTLSERLAGQVDEADADTDLEVQRLRHRLSWEYRRLWRAQEGGEPSADLNDALRATEAMLLERLRRNRLVAPAALTASGMPVDVEVDLAALQRGLGLDGALVEYGTLDDELFACVVTARGVTVKRALARWSDVEALARAARFQLDTLRHGAPQVLHHLPALEERARRRLQQLHAAVWAPLLPCIAGCARVVVVPHAGLAWLPFGALHDGTRYVIDTLEVALAPSARAAALGLARVPAPARNAVVIGETASLPHVLPETRRVAAVLPQARVFVGAQASTDTLRAQADGADLLHLACHAQFRADSPLFSALHLHDGAMTAEAIESLRLPPGVVVLNACETGGTDGAGGDEMIGLARAFLVAGAARVVATLWPVADEAAQQLIVDFYAALREHPSPAAALARAQRQAARRTPHPFYWAGFTVFGGW